MWINSQRASLNLFNNMTKIYTEEEIPDDDPFKEMYLGVTDPIRIEEARRKEKVKKMAEEKKNDTGL